MRWVGVLLLLASCSRDLTVPPDPQPGRLTGRVVFAVPGRSDLRPAAGTGVTLLGSGLSATANQAGTFSLAPVEETTGVLLFSFDSNADGVIDRQRTERLEDWGAGVHRQVDLGDVVLGENAIVHGRVALADRPGAKSGLSGSAVFVPEGPFTAYTADDGSFVLPNLPPGALQLVVFRSGYQPSAVGPIVLRPAEDYGVKELVLAVSTEPQVPGSISGTLAFSPAANGKGDAAVTAQAQTGAALSAVVNDALGFSIASLPPALYTVAATRTGYTRARVFNVLVLPGKETALGALLVTDAPEADGGGYPPAPDGGGGPGDAGPCVGPNCTPCVSNAQCGATEWCDNFYCAPQCSPAVPCTNGRACDSATKTCVVPCAAGCPMGTVCEANVCRSACDGSFPCATGFVCSAQNTCVPECSPTLACAAQHLTCSGGQCVPKTSCSNDFDCVPEQMCLVGTCKARPTARSDGGQGPFVCASACQCRLGEWCTGGLCQPDVTPTLWFAADGGGTGASLSSPSRDLLGKLAAAGPKEILALRGDDRFYAEGGFVVPRGQITIAGGFTDCFDARWVRSDSSRSILAADAGVVVSMQGTGAFPLDDVRLQNLKLTTPPTFGCGDDAITAQDTQRLEVSRVEGGLEATTDCSFVSSSVNSLISCGRCQQFLFQDLRLKDTPSRKNTLVAIDLFQSSGTVRRLTVDAPSMTFASFYGVVVASQVGPVRVEDSRFPEVTAGGSGTAGVVGSSCGLFPLIVERNTFSFARSLLTQNSSAGVQASNCLALQVRDNLVDGTATVGPFYPSSNGIEGTNVGGVFERNVIRVPGGTSGGSALRGFSLATAMGTLLTLDGNLVTGGAGATLVDGLSLIGGTAPITVSRNTVDVGGRQVRGMSFSGDGFRVADNFVRATGDGSCGGYAIGLGLINAAGVFERNRGFGRGAAVSRGMSADNANVSQFEVYASHLWAGPAACNGESSGLVIVNTPGAWLAGSTLDVEAGPVTNASTNGLNCVGTTLFTEGNVIGSGGAANRRMFNGSGAGVSPPNHTRNYYWLDHASPAVTAGDAVAFLVDADAGLVDSRGNVFNGNVSPFDPVQPTLPDAGVLPRHRLGTSPLVTNRGPPPKKKDQSDVWLDLDQRARDAGASADLGCCERY